MRVMGLWRRALLAGILLLAAALPARAGAGTNAASATNAASSGTNAASAATNAASAHAVGAKAAGTNTVAVKKLSISFPKKVLPASHHLWAPDAPPIWSGDFWSGINGGAAARIKQSLVEQGDNLAGYFHDRPQLFAAHGALVLALLFLLGWMARLIRRRAETQEGLRPAAIVFRRPLAIGLVLALFAGWWIYPAPPVLWGAVLGAAMIIPAAVVLTGLVERQFRPALVLLVTFYLIDQVRKVAIADAAIARLLLLGEMVIGAAFFAWMLASRRFCALPDKESHVLRIGGGVLVILFGASAVANLCGEAIMATLLGEGILASAYVGLILIALHRFFEALMASALNVPPLGERRMIIANRAFLQARARRLLAWAAAGVWIYFVLGALSIRGDTFREVKSILDAVIQAGKVRFTLGNLVSFGVTIWVAAIVSSILRFTLREEIYPRVTLAAGLQYSISKVVHYAVLIIGLFAAVTALGVPLTHITILVSALSVGLGFGLQNIVNNFVSGIILLFERPVKVGDFVDFGSGTQGVITRIGIRASVMRTPNGAEVIIPNGNFISNNVTNWTLSGRQLVLSVPVALGTPIDAQAVLKALEETAAALPHISKEPAPEATLVNLVGGFLTFQIRAWADQDSDWMRVRSELSAAINAAMTAKNYTLK